MQVQVGDEVTSWYRSLELDIVLVADVGINVVMFTLLSDDKDRTTLTNSLAIIESVKIDALHLTRPSHSGCNRGGSPAGSLI